MKARKIKLVSFLLLLVLGLTLCGYTKMYNADGKKVIDKSERLTSEQIKEIQELCVQCAEETKLDTVILLQDDIGEQSARDFTDDYYDEHDFGYDQGKSGVLLLISEHDLYMNTCGIAIGYFSNHNVESILCSLDDDWNSYDYYSLCKHFIKKVRDYVQVANNSESRSAMFKEWFENDYTDYADFEATLVDDDDYGVDDDEYDSDSYASSESEDAMTWTQEILFNLAGSFAIAIISVAVITFISTRTGGRATANTYINPASFRILRQQDTYLRTTVSKRKIESSSSHGRGGGSGSFGGSHHRSSSGRSHGGGGHHR